MFRNAFFQFCCWVCFPARNEPKQEKTKFVPSSRVTDLIGFHMRSGLVEHVLVFPPRLTSSTTTRTCTPTQFHLPYHCLAWLVVGHCSIDSKLTHRRSSNNPMCSTLLNPRKGSEHVPTTVAVPPGIGPPVVHVSIGPAPFWGYPYVCIFLTRHFAIWIRQEVLDQTCLKKLCEASELAKLQRLTVGCFLAAAAKEKPNNRAPFKRNSFCVTS